MNVAGAAHVPRIEIVDKEILIQESVSSEHLQVHSTINVQRLKKLFVQNMQKLVSWPPKLKQALSLLPVKRRQSKMPVRCCIYLSDEAGDFLVATAGPDLEGIIAAKGSGSI